MEDLTLDKRFWSEKAKRIKPYVAGEQPKFDDIIKLNTNESPFPPSPKAIEAFYNTNAADMRLYPDTNAQIVREAAAFADGVKPENIFVGNGSDDVLAMTFMALFDGEVKTPDVTYSFYTVWASLLGVDLKEIPLNDDLTIPVEKFFGGSCIIANPNAPTGLMLSLEDIEKIAANADGPVVIDEAYVAFGAETAAVLIDKYPNLLVVRTLSKAHGLAGLRMGYAIGCEDLIGALYAVKDSFNSYPTDRAAQNMAAAALYDVEYNKATVERVCKIRDNTAKELRKMGFSVTDSKTNFLFITHPAISAEDLMKKLRDKAIIVRRLSNPRTSNYLRMSMGTEEQMERVLSEIRNILEG